MKCRPSKIFIPTPIGQKDNIMADKPTQTSFTPREQLLGHIERQLMDCHDAALPDWSEIACTILDEVERRIVGLHNGEFVYVDDNVACIDQDSPIPTTVVARR